MLALRQSLRRVLNAPSPTCCNPHIRSLSFRQTLQLESGHLGHFSSRAFSLSACKASNKSTTSNPSSDAAPSSASSAPATCPQKEISFETSEPRLSLTFTCTVTGCGARSTHQFTRRSYERGIVLVECPGCKNRHLIADHLGWFKESTEDGKLKTVEDLVRAKGEKVKRGRIDAGGVVEYAPE
ncbi:hypothetical protein AcW1_006896 [Taiwanofungus camphoratus]|nr:hypothetical protein AcW1_006896 [Antrodia cinnamomea]